MDASRFRCALTGCVLLVLAGCGKYTITFQPGDVINDGGKGDSAREMLDVDIICLTKSDAKDFPELAEGTMRSQEWFSARDGDDQRLRKLDKRIYALRAGESSHKDKLVGPPLASGREGGREVTLRLTHPQAFASESAFVIFGRFHDGEGGMKNTRPVLIRPLPNWDTDILIGVGRDNMEWVNRK